MSQIDKNQESQIQYELISIQDLEEVNNLLVNEFFRNEPLGKHLGANPDTDVRPWISKVTKPLINQGVSIKMKYLVYNYLPYNILMSMTLTLIILYSKT